MPIISQQSLDLLVGLINSSNPDLPVPFTDTNVQYGPPTVQTADSFGRNTTLKVTAINSSQYIGNTTVAYRRIDLGTLFRAVPIVIYLYSPASAGASPYSIAQLLPYINTKYGLSLTTADVVAGNLPIGNTNAVPAIGLAAGTRNSSITVTAAAGSYAFVGSFTLYWVQAPEDISTMITVTSLENARVYPGNLETVSSGLYVPDLDVYCMDFTDILQSMATTQSTTIAQIVNELCTNVLGATAGSYFAQQTTFLNSLNSLLGKSGASAYNYTQPASTAMSLYGIQMHQAVLPNANVPEADSKYFDGCMYLDLPAANSWGAGRMIFHYND